MTKDEIEGLPDVERELYRVIRQIRINKCARESFGKKGHKCTVAPKHALFLSEILPMFRGSRSVAELEGGLNSLCRKGIVRFGRTINDTYFELTEYTDK